MKLSQQNFITYPFFVQSFRFLLLADLVLLGIITWELRSCSSFWFKASLLFCEGKEEEWKLMIIFSIDYNGPSMQRSKRIQIAFVSSIFTRKEQKRLQKGLATWKFIASHVKKYFQAVLHNCDRIRIVKGIFETLKLDPKCPVGGDFLTKLSSSIDTSSEKKFTRKSLTSYDCCQFQFNFNLFFLPLTSAGFIHEKSIPWEVLSCKSIQGIYENSFSMFNKPDEVQSPTRQLNKWVGKFLTNQNKSNSN